MGGKRTYYTSHSPASIARCRVRGSTRLKGAVDPRGFVWVVVGDAKQVRAQLHKLKLPIEVVEAARR
jgi:hypothetical protein